MNLEEENKRLKRENDLLKKSLEKERKEKEKIVLEKEKIIREFEEFKAKYTTTVSELRKALKIKPSNKSLPAFGSPKGHKGYARHIPERVDQIRQLDSTRCPHCNTKLGATQEIRSRYLIDIQLISKVKNTRYDIHRKYCPCCKKVVEPEVKDALPHARFGLNLMLLVMYLRLGLRLPCNKIKAYFMDMFNLKISEAEVIVILRQLVVAFGDYYSYLEKIVKLARVKHSDTTSWRINGKNHVAWVFIACGIVLYKIRKSTSHKAGLSFLGMQHGNVLVVDRLAAMRLLAKKAGFTLQLCWSHILEDSKSLAKDFGGEGKYVHKKLKEVYRVAKALNHKGMPEMVDQLKAEIFLLTLRHYKHTIIRKFVDNLYYRDGEDLFRFVTDSEIDSTNNISERELRALVIIRKISNGSRSRRGANATAMLLSVIQTLRFKGENVLSGLQAILKNPSGW
jgi:transposase